MRAAGVDVPLLVAGHYAYLLPLLLCATHTFGVLLA